MRECYLIKNSKSVKRIISNSYKLNVPNLMVLEYIFPQNYIYAFIKRLFVRKLLKRGVFLIKNYKSERKILERCFFYVLKFIFEVYGFNNSTDEIGIVIEQTNTDVEKFIKYVSFFARFLVIYGLEKIKYEYLFNELGVCAIYSSSDFPTEKVVIYIENEIQISILGTKYNDVDIEFNVEESCVDMNEFAFICREFATEDEYINLFENKCVKKMVLKSK